MTKLFSLIAILVFAVCGISPVSAHDGIVRECHPPERPENDQDDVAWQAFIKQVETFRHCVSDKMQWHELAAVRHNETARLERVCAFLLERAGRLSLAGIETSPA